MTEINPETVRAARDAATPGPWHWEISLASKRVELSGDGGELTVMDFVRWGMSGAAARFWRWSGKPRIGNPKRADELSIPAPGREHHADWFRVIDDPNARLIAMAPDLATAYLAMAEENERLTHDLDRIKASETAAINEVERLRAELIACRGTFTLSEKEQSYE